MFQWTLIMKEGYLDLPSQDPGIYTWGYEDINGFRTPGSPLIVTEGDVVEITMTNNLKEAHNFSIGGTVINSLIEPGQTEVVTFTAPAAGTYLYGDFSSPINTAMGLCGGLISMPAGFTNQPWIDGPSFDRQYLWVLTSLDSNWNQAVQNGLTVDINNYQPNYFFINGLAYPEAMTKMSTHAMHDLEGLMIHEMMDATVLIRIANASLVPSCLHWHGFHVKKFSDNRDKLINPLLKDNILLYPKSTVDVLLTFDKMGKYMVHDHILMAVTGNGVYPNGGLVMFHIM